MRSAGRKIRPRRISHTRLGRLGVWADSTASRLLLPNGLELGCPTEAGKPSLLYGTLGGQARSYWSPARRVSLSESLWEKPRIANRIPTDNPSRAPRR